MSRKISQKEKGEIVKSYLHKYREMGARPLSRIIDEENPNIFASTESIRVSIRKYRGKG